MEEKKAEETKNLIQIKDEDIEKLNVIIEKAKELVGLLERANELIQSLGNTTIVNNYSN